MVRLVIWTSAQLIDLKVMRRIDEDMFIVGHRNVLAFSKEIKTCTLEGSHDAFMRDLREFG
jgi:hypothetical protein